MLAVSEEPVQQFFALPYDRYEGYSVEREDLLAFIQQNGIAGVKFLTTDTHATLLNQVAIDFFTAPAPIAVELVTGPIATNTFEREVISVAGQFGLAIFNGLLTQVGLDCRNLNRNSYALVEELAGAGTLTLASKDENGAVIVDPITAGQCTITDGP